MPIKVALATLAALLSALTLWALTRAPGQLERVSASLLRQAIGAPEARPPVALAAFEPQDAELRASERLHFAPLLQIPQAHALEAPPPPRPPDLHGVSLLLLLGADNRDDRVVGRTDTMIVAAFRHRDGALAAFSVPRDLWVPLPDVGNLHSEGRDHARISSVVRVGEARLGSGRGLPLLRRVLLDELGLRIDRVASVDFRGFQSLVDELGGVDVDVSCPIMDCFWLDGPDAPCTMMSIEAGRQHMDGASALQFARSRHGSGDRDRRRRQQALILALARKARARGLRGLPALWRQAAAYIESDLEADDALYYASFMLDHELSDVRGFSIKHPMAQRHVTAEGKHVLLIDRAAFDGALEQLFDRALPALRGRKSCPDPAAALQR